MKIRALTECKNGFAQDVITVTEFLLPGNYRRIYFDLQRRYYEKFV